MGTLRPSALCYVGHVEFGNLDIPRELAVWCSFSVHASTPPRKVLGPELVNKLTGTPYLEHRTVTFPNYQGLGFASRACDAVAEILGSMNRSACSSKTAHPRYGSYRDRSPIWKPNPSNH